MPRNIRFTVCHSAVLFVFLCSIHAAAVEIISAPAVARIKYPDPSLVQQVSDRIVLTSYTMRYVKI